MDVGDDPKRQRLYVELVKTLAVRAYRHGFDEALPPTPLPELLEEGTVIVEMKALRETLLPTKGAAFSHGFSSPYETISHILHSVGVTSRTINDAGGLHGHLNHISTFLMDYHAMDGFMIDQNVWRGVPLEHVTGGYFALYYTHDMLTDQEFKPGRGEEQIIDAFCDAGFITRMGYRYRWSNEILAAHISHETWFPDGIPAFDDDED